MSFTDYQYKLDRTELLEHIELGSDNYVNNNDDKTRLLNSTKKLDNSSAVLENTKLILNNTIEQGGAILTNLDQQHETIQRSIDKVGLVDDKLYTSRQIMRGMVRRLMTNKFIIGGIITLLLLIIIVVIIVKWGQG